MSEQKVAVVTGGSAGIGEATCRALAKDGWARRLERCERIAEKIGGVDLLVNNAGGAKELDYLRDADDGDWEWMFETNVMGTMRVTRTLYPQLKASKGLVVQGRLRLQRGEVRAARRHARVPAGDAERANEVYEGKCNLGPEDIAEAVRWVASLPAHVNVDTMSIMPVDQAER